MRPTAERSVSASARLQTVVVVVAMALGLAACSGSGSGVRSPGASSGSSRSSTDLTAFAATLAASISSSTTFHRTSSSSDSGDAHAGGTGAGDVRTEQGGTVGALRLSLGTGAKSQELLYVNGTGYVKLPASSDSDPTKPWTELTDTSVNPSVQSLESLIQDILADSSLAQYSTFLEGATHFRETGATSVAATAAQGYSFDVDPRHVMAAELFADTAAGLGPIPVTMAVDQRGRPLQVVETFSAPGHVVTVSTTISNYGEKVDIAAPPAAQTSTG